VLYQTLQDLKLDYPVVSEEQKQELAAAAKALEAEDGPQDEAVVRAEARTAMGGEAAQDATKPKTKKKSKK
jgi:hypothetical protein